MELSIRAGMDPRFLDVDRLDQEVRGFTVINTYPVSEALRALSQIFLFDPSNYDGQVHFVPRGDDALMTITEDEMLDDDNDIDQARRADAIRIPRVLHLNYYDMLGGLMTEKQSSERSGDRRATGETSLQTAVLMESEEAAQAVAINHKIMIEDQRGELQFCLPDSFLNLVPTSCVFVQWQGHTVRARIIKADTHDGYQQYALLHDRQSAYTSAVQAFPISPPSTPPSSVVGPTVVVPLDIHIVSDADDAQGLSYYVAVTGLLGAWQGATVELSMDGGENYIDSATTEVSAVIGELSSTLGDHPQEFPDEVNTCTIRIHTPFAELFDATLEDLLNGDNLAIIGDELVQFGTADEVSDGTWEISYFLRGRKGTQTAAHGIGERFVLLDRSTITLIPASLVDIGRTLTFRATSFGTSQDDGFVAEMDYEGRSQIEREVGYLTARREVDDAIVSWQGIGRIGSGAQVAHGARFSGYRVTFDDGTIETIVDTQNQELTQDVSAMASPITITVVQVNELTGEGPASEVILI
jgi:hypothetical protein